MTTIKKLKKIAKELEHPHGIPLCEWKVTKIKGSPTGQYRLSYGNHYFNFYYFHSSKPSFFFGPRTALAVARYMVVWNIQESTNKNK